jgi:hypothetical protein
MAGTRQWLLVCLMAVGISDASRPAFAATPDRGMEVRVRTTSPIIATLIQHATEHSQTFRDLVQAINASDGIVYIEEGACGNGRRSCFVNVTKARPDRMLWVMLNVRGVDCDLMGSIGHELQHTIEVLGNPQVTNFATMYSFYAQEADDRYLAFETLAAKRIGEAVRAEVREKDRCTGTR